MRLLFYTILCLYSPFALFAQSYYERYFGAKERADEYPALLARTSDGGYAIAGTALYQSETQQDVFVVKTDSAGAEQWSRNFGSPESDELEILTPAADGGIILGGYTLGTNGAERKAWLRKWDKNGVLVWEKAVGGGSLTHLSLIQRTAAGDYLVLYSQIPPGENFDRTAVYFLRFDESGAATVPEQRIRLNGPFLEHAALTPDGRLVWIKGDLYSDKTLLEQYDLSGKLVWSKPLEGIARTGANTEKITFGADGAVYVVSTEWVFKLFAWVFEPDGALRWSALHPIPDNDMKLLDLSLSEKGDLRALMGKNNLKWPSENSFTQFFHWNYNLENGARTERVDTLPLADAQLAAVRFENDKTLLVLSGEDLLSRQVDARLTKADWSGGSRGKAVFSQRYGRQAPSPDEGLVRAFQAPDGAYYTLAKLSGEAFWLLSHVDAQGNLLQERSFERLTNRQYSILSPQMQLGADGGPMLLVANPDTLFLVKWKTDLQQDWMRPLFVEEDPRFFGNLLAFPNGDILVYSYGFSSGRMYFYRFDSQLKLRRKWEMPAARVQFLGLEADGSYVFMGPKWVDGSIRLQIVYFNEGGEIRNTYVSDFACNLLDIWLQTPDGGFVVSGLDDENKATGLIRLNRRAEQLWTYQPPVSSREKSYQIGGVVNGPCEGVVVPLLTETREPDYLRPIERRIEWVYLDANGDATRSAALRIFPAPVVWDSDPFFDNIEWTQWQTVRNGITEDVGFKRVVFPKSEPVLPIETDVLIKPNPVGEMLCVVLDNALRGEASISLYDAAGRKVRSALAEKRTHLWEHVVYLKDLSAGVYTLEIRLGGKTFLKRVAVARSR